MNLYVGIDVGKNGGIAFIQGGTIGLYTIPKIKDSVDHTGLFDIIKMLDSGTDKTYVIIEDVHSIFGTSAKSNFNFGYIAGELLGMIVACGFSYELVQPKIWQKEMWSTSDKIYKTNKRVDTKATSLVCAKRLFPNVNFLPTERSKKPHDGLVDALLLAEYGKRKFS